MESEDSHDGSGDAQSSSSSSSSSSRSRRSSTSSDTSKKDAKTPPRSPPQSPPQSPGSPQSQGPRSPSPESRSQSPSAPAKHPRSPDNLSEAHSDINSPENSVPASPAGPKSPDAPKSPSDAGSNVGSLEPADQYSASPSVVEGPKTPQSPMSSAKSPPGSPESRSRPATPDSASQPASAALTQFRNPNPHSRSSSPSPDRRSSPSSPVRSPPRYPEKQSQWRPEEKWRRHTKAEQKMVSFPRERSRSESSQSSKGSSYNKRGKDPATEEISEGEMESDEDDDILKNKPSDKVDGKDLNISHEDLSDVSDLDSMSQDALDKDVPQLKTSATSPETKTDAKINGTSLQTSPKLSPNDSGKTDTPRFEKVPQEKTSNTEDGEEQLDFEAEEGECVEPKPVEQANGDNEKGPEPEDIKPSKRSRGSSLEEGEVSDEAERRPEESEPRPVCRFFSRGACTWGISCRFLHPGVTDKGNYNMFDVVRGVPAAGTYPAPPARDVAPPESAWERGLRTAKEMLRIATKRKEQDMDFEEKKLHLGLGGQAHDPDAELAYAAAAVGASPPRAPEPHPRDPVHHYGRPPFGPPGMYRGRGYGGPRPGGEDRERFYERERGFERERVYERPPYDERAPPVDDMGYHKRRVRSSREVIVQRAEIERPVLREQRDVRTREPRGDEWADPWMRTEPTRRRKPQSSEDSYSSSSSSNSSSRSSRSPSSRRKRRASSSSRQRLSPSVIVRERRLATARATAMNPPAPRRRAPSPVASRQLAVNPPPPASHRHKDELDQYGRNKPPRDRKKYSRSSSSGSESSSSSSESESESHSSSTSGSSGARRARHARLLNAAARPRLNAKSSTAGGLAAAVTITSKKETSSDKEAGGRKRAADSTVESGPAKKAVSRREELLKQLKAVEDAIARKRSKI